MMMNFIHRLSHQTPSRVVLIGGTGIIGKVLASVLNEANVSVLSLGSDDINLLDREASGHLAGQLKDSDSVVLLAGLAPNRGRGLDTMVANISMGMSVCEALNRQPVAHVVYVSSDAVYPRGIEYIHEGTPVEPSDSYAAMHLMRERLLAGLSSMPVVILRCTQISSFEDTHDAYGPNRFRRMAEQEGRIVLFGDGEDRRDHITVNDVAAIVYRCLLRRSEGILNVATGHSMSFLEVAQTVAACYDPPPRIESIPRKIPLTHRHFDIQRLQTAFPDFRFTPMDADEREIYHQRQLLSSHR